MRIRAEEQKVLRLGRMLDDAWMEIEFDFSDVQREHPGGTVVLNVRGPMDVDPHPVGIDIDHHAGRCVWTVKEQDLTEEGHGECQLLYIWEDGRVHKKIWPTEIGRSLEPAGPVPEHVPAWIETLESLAGQTQINAQRAEDARDGAEDALKELKEGIESGDFRG